jgi:hypothetical protein
MISKLINLQRIKTMLMQIAQLHVTKKRDTIAINCIA